MKVIFLDVDGVLNSDEYIARTIKEKTLGIFADVDTDKIRLLQQAIQATGANIVLSTSWRYSKRIGSLKELLGLYGIYTDSTPCINQERGTEIRTWLNEHPEVEDYVILDDEVHDTFDDEMMGKLIKVSEKEGSGKGLGVGLMPSDIEEIINRLGKERGIDRER